MDQKTLVKDLLALEALVAHDTNLSLHVARIRENAEKGFYHLKAGDIVTLSPGAGIGLPPVAGAEASRTLIQATSTLFGIVRPSSSAPAGAPGGLLHVVSVFSTVSPCARQPGARDLGSEPPSAAGGRDGVFVGTMQGIEGGGKRLFTILIPNWEAPMRGRDERKELSGGEISSPIHANPRPRSGPGGCERAAGAPSPELGPGRLRGRRGRTGIYPSIPAVSRSSSRRLPGCTR